MFILSIVGNSTDVFSLSLSLSMSLFLLFTDLLMMVKPFCTGSETAVAAAPKRHMHNVPSIVKSRSPATAHTHSIYLEQWTRNVHHYFRITCTMVVLRL